MKIRKNINREQYDDFIVNNFVTCDECGYNNQKDRFQAYGTCLHCNKVLDDKVYFKAQLRKQVFKRPSVRGRNKTRAILYF